MVREIAQLGQPVLRRRALDVPAAAIESAEFQSFLDDMLETLRDAGGVGLAAPQVFESQRVFLAAIAPAPSEGEPPGVEIFVNPRLEFLSDHKVFAWEGCLSFLELSVLVPRSVHVRVKYLDRHGKAKKIEASGFPARVLQHENDHLDGVLTIDRAESTRHIVKSSEIEAARADFQSYIDDSGTQDA